MCALFLGVRADSTYTEAILAGSDGRRWGQVLIPNAEARSTRELLERAFQESSIDFPGTIPSLTAVMALPGLSTPALRRAAADMVKSILPTDSRIVLCDEMEPLLAGMLEGRPGYLVRSGSDAAVAFVDEQGVFRRVEHDPDPLGQEGSGLWLGTRTLQLGARIREGRMEATPRLVGLLIGHFRQPTLEDLWDTLMTQAPDPPAILQLARATVALAEFPTPEPACRALVVRTARRLGELVDRAQEMAPDGSEPSPRSGALYATWSGATLEGALLDELKRQKQHLEWLPPRADGLTGCLLLARALHLRSVNHENLVSDVDPGLWSTVLTNSNTPSPQKSGDL